MTAAPTIRLADADSEVGLINVAHSLMSAVVRDLTRSIDLATETTTLHPGLMRDPDVKRALSQVLSAAHYLHAAVSTSWERTLAEVEQ